MESEFEDFGGSVLDHLEAMQGQDPYEQQRAAQEAQQRAADEAYRHQASLITDEFPIAATEDGAARLVAEADARAARLGTPELSRDMRFLRTVAQDIGHHAMLDPVQQIVQAGGLGHRVLDF